MPRSSAPTPDATPTPLSDATPTPLSDATPTPLSDAPIPPVEEVQPPPLTLTDEYSGQGGSYTLDPATGIRTLVQRTKPSAP
jgi:hypothetical protein